MYANTQKNNKNNRINKIMKNKDTLITKWMNIIDKCKDSSELVIVDKKQYNSKLLKKDILKSQIKDLIAEISHLEQVLKILQSLNNVLNNNENEK